MPQARRSRLARDTVETIEPNAAQRPADSRNRFAKGRILALQTATRMQSGGAVTDLAALGSSSAGSDLICAAARLDLLAAAARACPPISSGQVDPLEPAAANYPDANIGCLTHRRAPNAAR